MATAIMFFVIPRVMKLKPVSLINLRIVLGRDSFVLNISFRIASSGLVNAAPAIPAVALLAADRHNRSRSYVGEDGSSICGSRTSIKSFISIAVQYLGTV